MAALPAASAAATLSDAHATVALAPAAQSATLSVYPAQVVPTGQPRVSGADFPPLTDLRLALACPDSRTEIDLGGARTDAAGRLQATVVVPARLPGACLLVAADPDGARLATAALTVLPALELTFAPQQGPPGTKVDFTVRNLAAGSLRLDYAGAAVAGPLPVAAGSYSGSFVVPHDRPDPLGSPAVLRAVNLAGRLVLGQVEQRFGSQPGSAPPLYRVVGMNAPVAGVAPGGEFVITGAISPAPPPGQATLLPVWKTATGKLFPIGAGQKSLLDDGSFALVAHVPSLKAGDPFLPQNGDQVGVAVLTLEGQALTNLTAPGNPWQYPGLNVEAVVAGSNPVQPISDATITVSAWPGNPSVDSLSQHANAVFSGALNQIAGSNSDDGELTEAEKLMVQIQMAACPLVGIPVVENDLVISVVNPPLEESLGLPAALSQMLVNTQLTTAGTAQVAAEAFDAAVQPEAPDAGTVLHYLVTVDAIAQGYGVLGDDNLPHTTSFRVDYHTADKTYRAPQGALLPDPVVVALPPLPSWATSQLGEIKAVFESLTVEPETTPGAVPVFGRYYSLTGLPPGIAMPATTSARVVAVLTTGQKHLLAEKGLKLYVDGVYKATFDIQFNAGITCNLFKGTKVVSKSFYVATATLVNPHLLAPGLRAVRIGATLQADPGKEISYHYKLRMEAPPPGWFAVQNQGTRSVEWRPWGVTYYNGWLSEAGSKQTLSSGAKTPQTGPLESDARANVLFVQSADASGYKSSVQSGQSKAKTLNKEGGGAPLNLVAAADQPAAAPLAPVAASEVDGVTKKIGPATETLVPPITFDLPEAKYGIPFVAEVAAGGSVSYGASVTYGGTITVQDDGSVQSLLSIDPEADAGGTVYVEGRLLSGLIGKAGASLTANFDLHMPVTYDTTKAKPVVAGTYFEYGADFKAWHRWGCVPYAGCAYSKTYPQHLFDGCEQLAGSTGCSAAASAVPVVPDEPPQFDIQLAADGQGLLMAIWPASLTSLATSLFDGHAWSAPQTIATGVGSSDPHVVFLAPNQALAVWVETTLPAGQPPSYYANIPTADAVKGQRLAYALWDGAGWSAPGALTTPLYGEGNLALAACSDALTCPAGGAAAAVWQRYVTADPLQRQIRLFYATFHNGAWGAPQPVDPASAATDILPQVAYRNGTPVVAWVRDGDIDMTDVASRRVALRTLGEPVVVPAELPNAIGEIGLAVGKGGQIVLAFTRSGDGVRLLDNRRPLWFATASCTGSSCTWAVAQQRDPWGRALYAERPLVTLNTLDQPTVTFRGMGFGPNPAGQIFTAPGDPPGMLFNTGELVQFPPNVASGVGAPAYLTQDGAVNWMPAAVFNFAASSTVALVVKGAAPVAQVGAAAQTPFAPPDPGLPVAFALAPDLPDFVVAAVEPSRRYPQPGEALTVTIRLHNQGAPWPAGSGDTVAVVATWDGAPGVGALAGQTTLDDLGDGGVSLVTLALTPPPGSLDVTHTLNVTVNPGQFVAEADATDNSLDVMLGGVRAPADLVAGTQAGSGLVFLQWTPSADARIVGYRIYRAAGAGPLAPAGSSLTAGWVDPTAKLGANYRYAVAAYTAGGFESELGEAVQVALAAAPLWKMYLPFVGR